MRFALRIPGDGRFTQRSLPRSGCVFRADQMLWASGEFDVIPPKGTLLPNCSQKVQIDFISAALRLSDCWFQAAGHCRLLGMNVKSYDLCLVVDLDGVGQARDA